MKWLDKETILAMHENIIKTIGGLNGIRDEGLFDSAINAPFASFGGVDLYPTLESKIVKITMSLIKNHAFLDGNKRIGINVFQTLFALNNIEMRYSDEDIIELGLAVADGTYSEEEILNWIEKHRKEK